MLYAFILACGILNGGLQCGAFTDEYGPYKTKAECQKRLEAMTPYAVAQAYTKLGPKARYDAMCGTLADILVKYPHIKGTELDPRKTLGGQEV